MKLTLLCLFYVQFSQLGKVYQYHGETILIIMMGQLLIKRENTRGKESRTHAVCPLSSVPHA